MIKTIIFDFDGVIVDSNHGKENAFYRLFEGHPNIPRELVADVLKRNERNVSTRFDILRDVFVRCGAPEERIAELVDESAARFDALVQEWIAKRGLAAGAKETLTKLEGQFCLYINSATPEEALQRTVANLRIEQHFKGIHGIPPAKNKEENLRAILGREGIEPQEAVVIGDGMGDLQSARACGTHFIAVASGFHDWKKENGNFPIVSDIQEAGKAISTIKV